jgi:hypothetical protein
MDRAVGIGAWRSKSAKLNKKTAGRLAAKVLWLTAKAI